mmetsp:Transcript_36096/g.103798  ORF Transcript_36096/g.103798 Transcript_36096/m.103798 type:complete len:181 (+) Transcript_36096:72-614(+)
MAGQVYHRLLEFRALRRHLAIGSEAVKRRREQMLEQYLAWCMKLQRDSPESYVSYLDHVASVHNRGRHRVPCSHLLIGLAITQDVFIRHLCASTADKEDLQRSACAVSKIIWIQAVFFARHCGRARPRGQFWRSALTLLAVLAAYRRLLASATCRRLPACVLDMAAALAGTLAIQRFVLR